MDEELTEIRERLARIETKLDMMLPLEARVRELETRQAHDRGKNAVLGAVAGGAMGAAFAWLGRHLGVVLFAALVLAPTQTRAADPTLCARNLPYGTPALPAQVRTTLVCKAGYAAMHDDALLIPRWVAYRLTGAQTLGCHKRRDNFHAEPSLPKTARATPADYEHSGYHKGHMAPAQDFASSAVLMSDSFSLANMAPQVPGLNTGQWLRLEESVRAWSLRGELLIYVGPFLDASPPTIGRGVGVPRAFGKVVTDIGKAEALAFAMPQESIPKGPLEPWQFTVSDLERASAIALPLPAGIDRMAKPALWPADRSGWNRAHRAACRL